MLKLWEPETEVLHNHFFKSRFIAETVQERALVTMEDEGRRMRSIEWCHF